MTREVMEEGSRALCPELRASSDYIEVREEGLEQLHKHGRLSLFESRFLPSGNGRIAFVGGPVSALDFHPWAKGICAIAAHRSQQQTHKILKCYEGSAHIQLWRFSQDVTSCVGVVEHNGDCAWDLKWRPDPSEEDGSTGWRGTVAAALGDGTVLVCSIDSFAQTPFSVEGAITKRLVPNSTLLRVNKNIASRTPVRVVEWSKDGNLLVVGAADGSIEVYDATSVDRTWPKWAIPGHESVVMDLRWLSETHLCSLGLSCVLRLRDIRDPFSALEQNMEGLSGSLSMDTPEPNVAVVGGDYGYLRVIRLSGGDGILPRQPVKRVRLQSGSFRDMCSIPVSGDAERPCSQTLFYTGGVDGLLHECKFPRPIWTSASDCEIARTQIAERLRWRQTKEKKEWDEEIHTLHLQVGKTTALSSPETKRQASENGDAASEVDLEGAREESGIVHTDEPLEESSKAPAPRKASKKSRAVGRNGTAETYSLFGPRYKQSIIITRMGLSAPSDMLVVGISGGVITWMPLLLREHEQRAKTVSDASQRIFVKDMVIKPPRKRGRPRNFPTLPIQPPGEPTTDGAEKPSEKMTGRTEDMAKQPHEGSKTDPAGSAPRWKRDRSRKSSDVQEEAEKEPGTKKKKLTAKEGDDTALDGTGRVDRNQEAAPTSVTSDAVLTVNKAETEDYKRAQIQIDASAFTEDIGGEKRSDGREGFLETETDHVSKKAGKADRPARHRTESRRNVSATAKTSNPTGAMGTSANMRTVEQLHIEDMEALKGAKAATTRARIVLDNLRRASQAKMKKGALAQGAAKVRAETKSRSKPSRRSPRMHGQTALETAPEPVQEVKAMTATASGDKEGRARKEVDGTEDTKDNQQNAREDADGRLFPKRVVANSARTRSAVKRSEIEASQHAVAHTPPRSSKDTTDVPRKLAQRSEMEIAHSPQLPEIVKTTPPPAPPPPPPPPPTTTGTTTRAVASAEIPRTKPDKQATQRTEADQSAPLHAERPTAEAPIPAHTREQSNLARNSRSEPIYTDSTTLSSTPPSVGRKRPRIGVEHESVSTEGKSAKSSPSIAPGVASATPSSPSKRQRSGVESARQGHPKPESPSTDAPEPARSAENPASPCPCRLRIVPPRDSVRLRLRIRSPEPAPTGLRRSTRTRTRPMRASVNDSLGPRQAGGPKKQSVKLRLRIVEPVALTDDSDGEKDPPRLVPVRLRMRPPASDREVVLSDKRRHAVLLSRKIGTGTQSDKTRERTTEIATCGREKPQIKSTTATRKANMRAVPGEVDRSFRSSKQGEASHPNANGGEGDGASNEAPSALIEAKTMPGSATMDSMETPGTMVPSVNWESELANDPSSTPSSTGDSEASRFRSKRLRKPTWKMA